MNENERTVVIVKPDGVARGLVGTVISVFEDKGLDIVGLRTMWLNSDLLAEHYDHLIDEPFYPMLEEFMISGPVVAICLEGRRAVQVVREMTGVTDGAEAGPETIRGRFSIDKQRNVVHASEDQLTAKEEISRFFREEDLLESNVLGTQ